MARGAIPRSTRPELKYEKATSAPRRRRRLYGVACSCIGVHIFALVSKVLTSLPQGGAEAIASRGTTPADDELLDHPAIESGTD